MSCELDCWKEYQTASREKLAKSSDGNDTTAEVTTPVLSATSGSAEFFDHTPVFCQKEHDLADLFLLLPTFTDVFQPIGTNPFDVHQGLKHSGSHPKRL